MIDEMTLAEATEVFAYWQDNPPAHLLLQALARLFGWTPAAGPSLPDVAAAPPPGLAVRQGGEIDMPAPFTRETLAARNRTLAARASGRPAPFSDPR